MDIAIEYQAKLLELRKMVQSLNKVGIKAESYSKRIDLVEEITRKNIAENKNTMRKLGLEKKNILNIYIQSVAKLDEIKRELQKYNVYFEGYHYCEYLELKRNSDNISKEEIEMYSKEVIKLLYNINNSDTRDYEEEKEIVEKIYSLAFQIMKLEFQILGKSEIFDYVKQNPTSELLINNEIEKEVNNLPKEKLDSKLMQAYINKIKSTGINYSYMDKVFITMLALND